MNLLDGKWKSVIISDENVKANLNIRNFNRNYSELFSGKSYKLADNMKIELKTPGAIWVY